MRFRVAFFGTPSFALPSLRALIDGPDEVVAVVCQPDRPAGRGQKPHMPPVKQFALAQGLPLFQPLQIRDAEFERMVVGWNIDLAVVAAYGRILPKNVLVIPPYGFLNVHASLLPKYRGAAPIQWAILRGETETGVTIMQMNERMDEGDILFQESIRIGDNETYGELQDRLANLGARALLRVLEQLHAGKLCPIPQDHSAATFSPMIRKEDGRIDWSLSAEEIVRRVRAYSPWPSAFTRLNGKLLKIHRARPLAREGGSPGTVVATGDLLVVSAGSGCVGIESVQLEGRKPLSAAEFCRGGHITPGTRLGEVGED